MRPVNLIPSEAGRGGTRSGIAPYVLLGALATLLAGAAFYVLTHNTVIERRAEVASLRTRVTAAQAEVSKLESYREFATLAQTRVETVRQLGRARFDWHRTMRDLSKVMPDNVWLTSVLGTVAPGVAVEGAAGGATSTLRSAVPTPAIEMTGCTTEHDNVVRLMSRLRLVSDVTRVALADTSKDPDSSGGGGGGTGDSDCRHGHANFPKFELVIFFSALPTVPTVTDPATAAVAAATGQVPQSATTATPPPTGTATSNQSGSDIR